MERVIQASGLLTIVFIVLIFVFLLKDSLPLFKTHSLTALLTGRDWYPISDPARFGLVPLLAGSLAVTLGSIVIAVPLGVAAAIYLAEVARPSIRESVKPVVEMLAAIPSVVFGFIGLLILAPYVKSLFDLPTGLTAMTGSIMLAFMALPTIISISEDAISAVPREYREASLALGATQWQTISRVMVPAALSGITAAVMLGIGRVIGETMTVLMVTGNAALIPHSITQPVRTMTATIAAEMGETVQYSEHYFALFSIGAVLFVITFAINFTADIVLHRFRRVGR
ncbi:MAG: phosphate ABC transporter permease subunit PstC [bacterium]|nr:phosphate ABC transporter permease subunit PstC [bacterium]